MESDEARRVQLRLSKITLHEEHGRVSLEEVIDSIPRKRGLAHPLPSTAQQRLVLHTQALKLNDSVTPCLRDKEAAIMDSAIFLKHTHPRRNLILFFR